MRFLFRSQFLGYLILLIIGVLIALPYFTNTPHVDGPYTEDAVVAAAGEYLDAQISENTEINVLGYSSKDNWFLYWFRIGDSSHHTYVTVEFAKTKSGTLHPTGSHKPIDRGGDVASIPWFGGYFFMINTNKCTLLELITPEGTKNIPVNGIPFVYYIDCFPLSYRFLDDAQEEI